MKVRERVRNPVVSTDGRVASTGADGTGGIRGQSRGRKLVAAAAAVAVVVSGGLWALLRGDDGAAPSAATGTRSTSTAKVTRQDLVSRSDMDGTLGYAGELSVIGHLQGTVTATAAEGAVVERGQTLYSVENRPVPLLYGDLPAWRALTLGMGDGPDVRQLEENLVALGFATEEDLTVDEEFTSATAAAVRRWQEALGVAQTGTVDLGQAVFLPGPFRVGSVNAEKGSQAVPGAPVMEGSSTTRVVEVDLDAARQALVKVGDKVDVKLPGGRTTPGTVAKIGTVAQTKGQGESAKQVIGVTVSLDDPAATGTLDQAPVKVGITADSRKGVLAVPVSALLALSEGGYGVRVVESGARGPTSRIVAVETGLFARGMVEVRGDGLREGIDVEVPAS